MGEDVPFVFSEHAARGCGEREGNRQDIQVLGQEGVEGRLGGAGVPGCGEAAVRVAEVGEVVTLVGAGGGGWAWRRGVRVYLAAEGGEDARDLVWVNMSGC